jgi:GNAT superfamily N-acetyltransferase
LLSEPLQVGDVTITQVDLAALTEDDIVTLNTFGNILKAESNPQDPPTPVDLTRANVRNIPDFVVPSVFWARDPDGSLAATAEAVVFKTEDNQHLMDAGINVRPDRRRLGIGSALLRLVTGVAEESGRRLVMFGTSERVPAGAEFVKKTGAEAGLAEHTNRLILSKVDAAMVDRWAKEGPGRAPGYSLVPLDGPYPDELYEKIIAVHEIMNTAPRDDLDMEDWKITPEQMRAWEKRMIATGSQRWSLFAQHDATGEWIGYTEVTWNPKQPKFVWQLGTGVRPDHRGHALGKWLKGAMLRRILDERTEADELRTGNADSNDAMLGINDALGFERFEAHTVWQVSLDRLTAYVGSSV